MLQLQCRRWLLAGSALWCLTIIAAPIFHLRVAYQFFASICHQDPLRSWHINLDPLPVCIRCMAIYVGFLLSTAFPTRRDEKWLGIAVVATLTEWCAAQVILDSAWLRAATGVTLGAAVGPFVAQGVEEMLPILTKAYNRRGERSAT
jgi:uncharacterized membrane protein